MTEVQTLLIEIGTEDLPPVHLNLLAEGFLSEITKRFKAQNIPFAQTNVFATPRRLAVTLSQVPSEQPDYLAQKRGPQLSAAFKDGKPTPAALGFAKSCKADMSELKTLKTEQGEWLLFEEHILGKALKELLPKILEESILTLNAPKKMRWSDGDLNFMRPIHWITLVHGDHPIEITVFEYTTSAYSYGHRFHHPEKILLKKADLYQDILKKAKVLVDSEERKSLIQTAAQQIAAQVNGTALIDEALLDMVTGLVEWPVAMKGKFESTLLKVPQEALISAMQYHQKCFPILSDGKLMPYFILISNLDPKDHTHIIRGNERVMRARLEDAKFFYEQDCKQTLESHLEPLKAMIYQKKLGTLYEKVKRIAKLSKFIAEKVGANPQWAERAGLLCKADLTSHMVFEFPELQGIMGRYYATHDKEPQEVALALEESYLPKSAKGALPQSDIGKCVALAERLDTLVGIFGAGLIPSGDKDPYALRRAAMGVLRILIENKLPFDLKDLLLNAQKGYPQLTESTLISNLLSFFMDRFKAWYLEKGITPQAIDAVLSTPSTTPYDLSLRTLAVDHFQTLEEAQSLAAANKRVKNILTKNNIVFNLQKLPHVTPTLLKEPQEKALFNKIEALKKDTAPFVQKGQYQEALSQLAHLKEPVDQFFDKVLVMAEEEDLRNNRIHLLTHLYGAFMEIADISRLAL